MTTLDASRTTSDTPADHVADHNALHAAYNSDVLWLPAQAFSSSSGSPAQATVNGMLVWLLDAATDESVSSSVHVPDHWTTWDVYAVTAPTTGIGNARGAVDVLDATDSVTDITSAAWSEQGSGLIVYNSTNIMESARIVTGASVLSGDYQGVRFRRDADNAGDTYANDLRFLGLRFQKVS